MNLTPSQAKKIVAQRLTDIGAPSHKLTAKTVSFSGFGYGSKVFVTVHGWKPELHGEPTSHVKGEPGQGFCVEFNYEPEA